MTILPDLTEEQLNDLSSQGEAKVYRSLRDHLGDDYLVLFQVGWILRREKDRARDGETDFLICHPTHGYLCVEVKGGGIGFDSATNKWYSIDRHGRRHEISDPIAQARRAKYSVRSKLDEHHRWRALSLGNVLRGHAVFFPDIGDANAPRKPDLPPALVRTAADLQNPRTWIDCDEGQDFREEFWIPLELLLADYDRSPLYVFYDDNQNIYARASTFPISGEPFSLTRNCRNTAPIHTAAYTRYRGVPVSPPDNEGDDVHFDPAPSPAAQAGKIRGRIVDLIVREGLSPGEVAVLIADARDKADYYAALRRLPLPKLATWCEEGIRNDRVVLIDTVSRFKGLEASVVFLWGIDGIDWKRCDELLYVGVSRAKSLLVVVGTNASCATVERELR